MATLPKTSLKHRQGALASPVAQRELLDSLDLLGIPPHSAQGNAFDALLAQSGRAPLHATGIEVFQINTGRICNQACAHCHVDAGPDRREIMSPETAALCLEVLAQTDIPLVDITGGAPEMCPSFRDLVVGARALGRRVIDRCNLTILSAKGFEDLPEFLAEHQVEVVCSLPHYRALSTDKQRGEGVFDLSIQGLRRLNELGYGQPGSGLELTLVTNPVGAFLPAGQASLTSEWKRELKARFDIDFNHLFTITNMPISRYLEWLEQTDNLASYMQRLVSAFNPVAADGVMCRNTLSVGWTGRLFDCDFNQMLDREVGFGAPVHLKEFDFERLAKRRIVTDRHCFGCTAGAGSSCGGALESEG
jgi:radical SAM/Cys-rich protein